MKRHTLLLVDDEPANLNLLDNLLGGDYTLHRARGGAVALKTLRRHKIDLVLADQRMPRMSGVELLEKAREVRPDAVRILITAYPDAQNAIEAINRGNVHRYVAKPFEPAELRMEVQRELARRDLVLENRRMGEELRKTVRELSRVNRRLEEINTMKDEFLANCSHELKTPLVSGMGYLELMLSGGLGRFDDRQLKGLRISHRNLERLLSLIENLLALSRARYRPGQVRKKRFALMPLIQECVDSLKARAHKGNLKIRISAPRRGPVIYGDERKIHSVLTNVLSNAEKFTRDDAQITIRVGPTRKGRVHISVSDNGVGLPTPRADIRPFHGNPDPRYGGLGIGLTLARQFLKAHGSDIVLERRRPRGAVARFDLPVVRP